MTLIDGKAISEQVKQEIAAEVAEIVARDSSPHLSVTRQTLPKRNCSPRYAN